jgi:lipoate-protein ligase A
MSACQLFIDTPPHSGAWNMAVDEALLEAAVNGAAPVMRWYQWDQATLSLGYFQQANEWSESPQWSALPAVRRLSGGGAILHHDELTYSCVLPATHPLTNDPYQVYLAIHNAVIKVLQPLGFDVRLRATRFGKDGPAEAFLCFSRGDEMDVVIGTDKVLGSAQRRRRGAVLQHGSLVLRKSEFAPQFPGLFDLAPPVDRNSLLETLAQATAEILGQPTLIPAFETAILERAQQLHDEKYTKLDWSRANPLA